MDETAQTLLAGPRGERLCLELATRLDPQILSSVFWLSYEHDPGKGVSTVRYTLDALPEDGEPGTRDQDPQVSVEHLARELHALEPDDLPDALVQLALAASVDSARYWQEADGEDVLAGQAVIHNALHLLAERVMASVPARRWRQPCTEVHWVIDWTDDDRFPGRGPHRDPARWARETRADETRAEAERPGDPHANWSGEWWSVPLGLLQSADWVPEALDLVEDSMGWPEAVVTPVRGTLRVFEISGAADWIRLCQEYPLEVTASRRHDWFRVTGRDGRWVIPDWELVAETWDAVHLTVLGYLSSATRALDVDDGVATVIAGWDPGTTYWLTGAGPEAAGEQQRWRRDDDGETWSRVADR